MSRAIQRIPNPRPVIAKAYGGEPVQMRAVGYGRRFIEVARVSDAVSIGLPVDHVFEFDPNLFEKLQLAYRKGRIGALNELWELAVPHKPLTTAHAA